VSFKLEEKEGCGMSSNIKYGLIVGNCGDMKRSNFGGARVVGL